MSLFSTDYWNVTLFFFLRIKRDLSLKNKENNEWVKPNQPGAGGMTQQFRSPIPPPTRRGPQFLSLTTIPISSCIDSGVFWAPPAPGMNIVHVHTCRQTLTCKQLNSKIFKNSLRDSSVFLLWDFYLPSILLGMLLYIKCVKSGFIFYVFFLNYKISF